MWRGYQEVPRAGWRRPHTAHPLLQSIVEVDMGCQLSWATAYLAQVEVSCGAPPWLARGNVQWYGREDRPAVPGHPPHSLSLSLVLASLAWRAGWGVWSVEWPLARQSEHGKTLWPPANMATQHQHVDTRGRPQTPPSQLLITSSSHTRWPSGS